MNYFLGALNIGAPWLQPSQPPSLIQVAPASGGKEGGGWPPPTFHQDLWLDIHCVCSIHYSRLIYMTWFDLYCKSPSLSLCLYKQCLYI